MSVAVYILLFHQRSPYVHATPSWSYSQRRQVTPYSWILHIVSCLLSPAILSASSSTVEKSAEHLYRKRTSYNTHSIMTQRMMIE